MGKRKSRQKRRTPAADADVLRAIGSGARDQSGWGQLLKLDHQDKLIIACIFALAVGKLLSAFFYPEDAAEEEDDGEGGFLGILGLRL